MEKVKQDAFDEINCTMAHDTLLNYPDFNETFKFYNNVRAPQLGAVIIQKGKTIAFYSRKLANSQQMYIVTQRKLISIVKTLKEFRTILLGRKIRIYNDHKNLTYKNFNTNRVLRLILILDEYGPDIEYIKGEKRSSRLTINISLKWVSI